MKWIVNATEMPMAQAALVARTALTDNSLTLVNATNAGNATNATWHLLALSEVNYV